MTIITSKYRSDMVRLFVDDVTLNDYYLFVSGTSNTSTSNTSDSKTRFLERTIFGKKITREEVFFMVRNYPWEPDTVYDQYDDTVDLSGKKYYTIVYPGNNETGDYRVYKCLFNNYGAPSENPPNYNETTPDQVYIMPDGYVWKFLFAISETDFDKYNTRGYIPLPNANTVVSSETSNIDQIFVTNPTENRGYEKVDGVITSVVGDSIVISAAASELSAIENYYARYSLYVTNEITKVSQVYEIDTYVYNPSLGTAVIRLVEDFLPDGVIVNPEVVPGVPTPVFAKFSLVPRIEIRGDGTGAVAIPNISDGSIVGVTVLNKGSGYTRAVATVPDPYAFDPTTLNSLDARVSLRPILSPKGGHGSNLVDELSCRHVLTYVGITTTDNNIIPTTNDFTSVGLVRNPEFKTLEYPDTFDNRIELALDSHSLSVNETITQIETSNTASDFYNEVRFSGKVHEIANNNIVYISEYMGAYPNDVDDTGALYANTDFSDISLRLDLPLLSSQNQVIQINTDNNPAYPPGYDFNYPGFKLSPYVQRSGEVYYMHRFFPITRTDESREQFKLILEF